jgi:hypothetical protein
VAKTLKSLCQTSLQGPDNAQSDYEGGESFVVGSKRQLLQQQQTMLLRR